MEQQEPNKTASQNNQIRLAPLAGVAVLFALFIGFVVWNYFIGVPEWKTVHKTKVGAESTVDTTAELAMRVVHGDFLWRWVVPLLIFFLAIDGTVITMYLALINKKLDRLPTGPLP